MEIIEIALLLLYVMTAVFSLFGIWLGYHLAARSESYESGQKWMDFADLCMSIFACVAFLGLFFILYETFLF